MGFYQWVQLGYMGARMETFWFTLTYWCTPSSGTVRFTPECTNVPQPRCTEVPNSSGLRYSVPGTPWFAEVQCTWYTLVCWGTSSSGAVRGRSVSHANLRPVTALHYTSHYTSPRNIVLQHRPEIRRVVLHPQVECKAPLNSAENWNVHFSKKEIRHCPAGEPAGFS